MLAEQALILNHSLVLGASTDSLRAIAKLSTNHAQTQRGVRFDIH